MNSLKKIIRKHYTIIPSITAIILVVTLLLLNNSYIFEKEIVEVHGDQRLYYELSLSIVQGHPTKSLYSLGYPFFYIPFIILTGVKANWQSIMPYVVLVQSLFLIPASISYIFSKKSKSAFSMTFILLTLYYLFLLTSSDSLIKYNILGLIPLSEPLNIFLLLTSYHIYISKIQGKWFSSRNSILLGCFLASTVLVRQVSAILLFPIIIDMFIQKNFRTVISTGLSGLFFLSPQLIYNYFVGDNLFFNGYEWWAEMTVDKANIMKESTFGFSSNTEFSLQYFVQNAENLLTRYIPIFVFICYIFYSNFKKRNVFVISIAVASLLNTILYLSYWWSGLGGLIDRFLLPMVFLLLYIFNQTYSLKKHNENRQKQ